jgi:hypothetical protein
MPVLDVPRVLVPVAMVHDDPLSVEVPRDPVPGSHDDGGRRIVSRRGHDDHGRRHGDGRGREGQAEVDPDVEAAGRRRRRDEQASGERGERESDDPGRP